ncbi:Iron transport multicopper oxidase FET3 [Nakaseomyces bracarensis]|uniref:Iron transport multicopper oxidase FET3 n=1 Tax=Nakaseomyces bracarensis TaxID=273131 RepID=A0ABR4NVS5_9SACH
MYLAIVLLATLRVVSAATHVYNWTTGWDWYNVDGIKSRPVITCNGQFPWPDMRVTKGDRIIINLTNGFNNSNTSLHFHGLFQRGNNQMDGVPFLTQCPISPGDTMVYNFTVDENVGTYWYHSHTEGQYEDGFRSMIIIEDGENNENFPYEYDVDLPLSISDWYHKTVDVLTPKFLSVNNPTGAEPIPQNLIINDTKNLTWEVEPDTTYLLRIANIGGFVSQYFWIEDHEMEVVEIDGVYVEKNVTDMLYITVAQRYSVLIHTKNDTSRNFAIMQKFDDTMLDVIPKELQLNATSFMVYNKDAPMPEQNYVDSIDDYLDDFYLVPLQKEELYPEADHVITVDVVMDNLRNGVNYAFFNNITYTTPKVPALLTALSSGDDATNPFIYGTNTNTFVLKKDEIVDLVVNNMDTGKHPFHLHGHIFQMIYRDRSYDDALGEVPHPFDDSNHSSYPEIPVMRDTVYLNPQSSIVLRFKADNPGVWFFHCHIEWHLLQGLAIVLVEDPLGIQETQSQHLTPNGLQVCGNGNIQTAGNAAGNTDDLFNLKGQNIQQKAIPSGFTGKGIVAMTFSCLAGILGVLMISIYGFSEISEPELKVINDLRLSPEEVLEKSSSSSLSGDSEAAVPKRKKYMFF